MTGLVAVFGLGLLAPGAGASRTPLPGGSSYQAQARVTTDFAGGIDIARAVVAQPDGRVVAAGEAWYGGHQRMALARYLPDGALDPSFGQHGLVTTTAGDNQTMAWALALQPDGRLVAAGAVVTPDGLDCRFLLVRYLPDGRLDPTFGTGGVVTTDFGPAADVVHAVTVLPDGRLVAAGAGGGDGGSFALARYLPDGRLDPTFGHGGLVLTDVATGPDEAEAVLAAPDGTLIAVGPAHAGGYTGLVRYRLDGSLDPGFGTGGIALGPVGGLGAVLQPDGRIVVAGQGSAYEPPAVVARYLPDGSLDATFGDGGVTTIPIGRQAAFHDVLLQADGKIVAAGTADTDTATTRTGAFRFAVARLNPDGSPDTGFGPVQLTDFTLQTDEAFRVAADPAGHIVAAGTAGFGYGNQNCDFALTGLGPLPGPALPAPPVTVPSPAGGSRLPGEPTTAQAVTPLPVVGGPATGWTSSPAAPIRRPGPAHAAAHPGAPTATVSAAATEAPSNPPAASDPAPAPGADRSALDPETLAALNVEAAARTAPAPETLPAPAVIVATLAAAVVALGTAAAFRRQMGAGTRRPEGRA